MKILVIHSQQPANQYAGGDDGVLDSEQYRMRPLASRIVDGLRAAGHDAHLGPLGTSYRDNVAWCNKIRGDLILSCHSNATGTANRGTGALIGIGSNRARPAAEAIAAELGKIVPGGASITNAAWIQVSELVDTYDPACLVEYYWHDQPDQAQWIRDNWPAMADATVRGLVARFGGTIAEPLASGLTHRVRWASALNVRATPPTGGRLGAIVTEVKGGPTGARCALLPDAAVRASDGAWWRKVRFEGGSQGWVNVNYLQPLNGTKAAL